MHLYGKREKNYEIRFEVKESKKKRVVVKKKPRVRNSCRERKNFLINSRARFRDEM